MDAWRGMFMLYCREHFNAQYHIHRVSININIERASGRAAMYLVNCDKQACLCSLAAAANGGWKMEWDPINSQSL
jgi:hypothetical protein